MATDTNRSILIGRLTADPDFKELKEGSSVTNFSIAVNRRAGKDAEDYVSFFNCTAWNKIGEIIVKYCKKGDRVSVSGHLRQDRWGEGEEKRSTIKIIVEEIQFLESQKNKVSEDEIPF